EPQNGRIAAPGIPSDAWRMRSQPIKIQDIPTGLDSFWHYATGLFEQLVPRKNRFLSQAAAAQNIRSEFKNISNDRLRELLFDVSVVFRRRRDQAADRVRAAALICETCSRIRGQDPFQVQIAGGLALAQGCLVEMATGEGKSLTATIPAIMVGWRGRGVHIITVNDYLAQRDAEQFAALYGFCGLSVDYVAQEMDPPRRRQAYLADITYCTNKEVCADYLRDRLLFTAPAKTGPREQQPTVDELRTRQAQRELYFAIVDEADSILIDEAVTPLIISGSQGNAEEIECYRQAHQVADQFVEKKDFNAIPRRRLIELTARGKEKLAELRQNRGGVWLSQRRAEELIVQALTARYFYSLGKQYVVQEDKIVIVDEFTGRLMPDRQWRDGLHQIVEAREGVEIRTPKETLARISFQKFFRLYKNLSGMSGTLAEVRRELWHVYRRPLIVLPTHRPCIRQKLGIRIFPNEEDKLTAVIAEINRIHSLGRPLLIGTRSVHASEKLSEKLGKMGLSHQVLNAVRHAQEAQIIAAAGNAGCITVATNMAGRGTDIRLDPEAQKAGGLHVIATESHESGRIDRQLAGRAGRQGDPGSSIIFASVNDQLVQTHAGLPVRLCRTVGAKNGRMFNLLGRLSVYWAQVRASLVSQSQRRGVARADRWLEESLSFASENG
ncbi:MAG TPA: prepilin peptidase, partial [Phycisphaerae bacterium]|nr:prepilin peptidase [Phycisphaerae bacterium]